MLFPSASWNPEILRSEALRCLWQGRGFMMGGVLAQFAVALYYIFISPFSLGREFADLVICGQLLATLAAFLSVIWLLSFWLAPLRARDESIDSLPISPVQRQLMDWLPLVLAPAALAISAMLIWFVLQLYFGVPFGSGSETGAQWLISDGPEGWREVPNPWWPRVLAAGFSILATGLLPLGIALQLQQSLRLAALRLISLLLLTGTAVYVMLVWGREFTQLCYRQTRGHDPLPYIVIGSLMLAMPLLLGLLARPARLWLAVALLALLAAVGLLPFIGDSMGQTALSAQLRDALGDSRFALAWFFGHTDFIQNIGWLLESWTSNLLLGTPERPLRIPMWTGAALLPFLYAVWLPAGYLLGMAASRRREAD